MKFLMARTPLNNEIFKPVPVPSEAKQFGCFGASVTKSMEALRNEYRAAQPYAPADPLQRASPAFAVG